MSNDLDRYALYMQTLADRDQAMLVIAALVLVGLLWWRLLESRPALRRWLAWGGVALYVASMAVMVLVGGQGV